MDNFQYKVDTLNIKTLQVCRTCMEEITQVNTEPTIRQKLSNCISALDLSIVRNEIICGTCTDSINFVYNFKNKCVQVELQILKYVQQLQHTGDVDLAEVVQFTQLHYRNLSTEIKTDDIEITENSPTLLSNDTAFNDGDHNTESTNKYLLPFQKVMHNDDKNINLEIKTCVCRTCMEEIVNIPFFHLDSIQVNTEPTIRQKLSNCISELDLSMVRNPIICGTCADTINFIYNFKNKCLQSELQIHKYIQQLQHTGDVDLAEVTQFNLLHYRNLSIKLKTEDIEVPENFKYQEVSILLNDDDAFNDKKNTNNQYLLSLQKVDTTTECVLFNTVDVLFNYSNPLKEENLNTHDNSNILQDCITQMIDNQDLGITHNFYECYTCGHKAKSKSKLFLHMKSHTGKKWHQEYTCRSRLTKYNSLFCLYRCCLCNYLTKYKWLLGFHIRTHLTKKNYKQILNRRHVKSNRSSITFNRINKAEKGKGSSRSYNKEVLKSKRNLLRKYLISKHQFSQHDSLKPGTEAYMANKPFKCSVCEYKCRQKQYLKRHMLIHTIQKPFTCSFCEYQSKRKGHLKVHMIIHTDDKPFACSICEFKCRLKRNLTKHMLTHTGDKPFACSICEFKSRLKGNLTKHMVIHTGGKPFSCLVCECKFKRKDHLKLHMQIHTGEKQFTCSLCEYQCIQKSNLKRHMQIHTDDRPFTCSVCQYKCKCKSDLKKHIEIHVGEKQFACSVCEYRSITKSNLKSHTKIHTGDKPFTCSICEYKCRQKSHLKTHMQIHTEGKPFTCSFCEYQCRWGHSLKDHIMENHTGEKQFACSVCEFRCTRKPNIIRHMQIHTSPFACSVCKYRCTTKSILKKHMLIHTIEKPLACSICEYRCKLKSTLRLHMQIHTGKKRCTCSVCEYQCTQKYTLKRHMQIHTGDKPFACSVCEYRSIQKSSLKRHMKIHTGDKPFTCSVCEYRFRQKTDLRRHMKIHT